MITTIILAYLIAGGVLALYHTLVVLVIWYSNNKIKLCSNSYTKLLNRHRGEFSTAFAILPLVTIAAWPMTLLCMFFDEEP